ncbi:hypothetical protein [Arenimonas metalli]|uniref:DUF4426 domain-containing protein n=1 Tax=Arenimonas metalli CF5-1 TaxID=1384056 RepID=A0A091ARD7_9GAMM|nr:hypothetical protein [Arenimonas metalli]KFN41717.1 hypothetical protein N787_05460 [Arenimonas metalli CF5-1]
MSLRILATLAVLLALLLPAGARAERIDDSGTQVLGSLVRLKWQKAAPQPGEPNLLVGQITVLVRLDMSPWKGRRGRIYHQLSRQGNPVTVSWTTRGALLPGEVRDGERTLVYAGLVTHDLIEDTFLLTLTANADQLSRLEQLEFSFEFEPEGG